MRLSRETPAREELRSWPAFAAISIVAVSALRALLAARVPLTGDEAYYWEWSRRLAAGYHDHPPMVAWIIALFDHGARDVFLVRLGFIACGIAAALMLAACASRAAGNRRAGLIAVVLFSFVPMFSIAFGTATPDGSFLLGWALSLYFALRAFESGKIGLWIALGAALGVTILSRLLGAALLVGLAIALLDARRRSKPLGVGPWLGAATLLLTLAPYLAWNSAHHWDAFAFAASRAAPVGAVYPLGPLSIVAIVIAAGSPGIVAVIAWSLAKAGVGDSPWGRLVFWTALPLTVSLVALSVLHSVEVYWLYGPLMSLLGAAAVALSRRPLRRAVWAAVIAPAALELLAVSTFALAPAHVYAWLQRTMPGAVRGNGPFAVFAYPALSRSLASRAQTSHAWVVTDGYGLSSVMDFYGGIAPVAVGANPQGQESRGWYDPDRVARIFYYVDKDPLVVRGVDVELQRTCPYLRADEPWRYHVGNYDIATFYVSTCGGAAPAGFRRFATSRTWR